MQENQHKSTHTTAQPPSHKQKQPLNQPIAPAQSANGICKIHPLKIGFKEIGAAQIGATEISARQLLAA
jgi:hypothetical protein